MTARRQFGTAIAACVAGAGLVLLALRQSWARVDYAAPKPLPSGSIPVSGQDLLPAVGALALAALACLAAVIATRGLARRVAGLALAGLGAWIVAVVSQPVHAATVIAAASGQAAGGALAGTLPGGNSAISGSSPASGGLPEIGAASRVVLTGVPWRPAAVAGAVAVIAAGLLAAWSGPRWAVMSARFDRPARQPGPGGLPVGGASALVTAGPGAAGRPAETSPAAGLGRPASPSPAVGHGPGGADTPRGAGPPGSAASLGPAVGPGPGGADTARGAGPPGSAASAGGAGDSGAGVTQAAETRPAGPGRPPEAGGAPHPDGDAAALWEALDRGVDLTATSEADAGPADGPASEEQP